MTLRDSDGPFLVTSETQPENTVWIARNSIYAMLRAGSFSSVVISCRRFASAEAIAELIKNSGDLRVRS